MAQDTSVDGEPAGRQQGADPAQPAVGPESPPAAAPGRRIPGWSRLSGSGSWWLRCALALAGGLGQYAASPPVNWWPLAPAGVAAVLLAVRGVRGRTGALLGFIAGLGLMIPLLPWLTNIGTDAWIGLAVAEALYFALLGGALTAVTRLAGWPVWCAGLWVAQETLRTRFPLGGFPWGRLAFAETGAPYVHFATVGGAVLVTFSTALTGGLLACGVVWLRLARRRAGAGVLGARQAAVALGALLAAVAIGSGGLLIPTATGAAHGSFNVAIVQGNVPRPGVHFLGRPEQVLNNHVRETRTLAAQVRAGSRPQPDLVIWPENSSDLDPYNNPGARAAISSAARAVGVPILVGGVTLMPDGKHVQNRGIVWSPATGPEQYYVAQHLVPFGEQIPYRDFLSRYIKRLRMVPYNYQSGHRPGTLRIGKMRIGDVICFEMGFDPIVRGTVRSGARMLVDQTNDATYGRGAEPEQQFAMARLRAVEHDRPVAVASTTGISAVIDAGGHVEQRTKQFVPALLSARFPQISSLTLADRLGGGPEWGLTGLGVGALLAAMVAGRRKRRGA